MAQHHPCRAGTGAQHTEIEGVLLEVGALIRIDLALPEKLAHLLPRPKAFAGLVAMGDPGRQHHRRVTPGQ